MKTTTSPFVFALPLPTHFFAFWQKRAIPTPVAQQHTGGLHHASIDPNPERLRALLAAGEDPNARDEFGVTPLHLAIFAGNEAAVALLLSAGADPRLTAEGGATTLLVARTSGNRQILRQVQQALA